MSEVQEAKKAGGKGKLVWAGLGLIAIVALLYGAWTVVFKSKPDEGLAPLAKGEMSKLIAVAPPGAPAVIAAEGPDGKPMTLADLKGQVVVVNLWATWCAPCVTEMPALAKLQAAYPDKLKVVPISVDKGEDNIAKAKAFIAEKAPLRFYHGETSLVFSLSPPAEGLPTTILYDRQGRERARLSGGADWSTPEAKAVIDRLLAQS